MKTVDLSNKSVVFDYTTDLKFINHPYTSLQMLYEDGTATIILNHLIEEDVDIDDDQINLWIPFLSVPEITSLNAGYITSELCNVPNIEIITIININDIARINQWILNDSLINNIKTIQFLGKPSVDIILDGSINKSIKYLNIPLNQNLMELYTNNSHLVGIGINGDNFGYWNMLPPIHLTVYTTSIINMKHIQVRLRNHTNKTILLR